MTRKEELLEVSCKDYYMYSNIIRDLLNKGILDECIQEISDDNFGVHGSCIFKTDFITHSELFIYNIDRFIYFFKHKLLIEEGESRYILEIILKSKYVKLFLEKTFCFDMKYIKYYDKGYKKIICDNFFSNLKYLKITFPKLIEESKIDIDNKKNSDKNLNNIFKLLTGLVNCKRHSVHVLFEDIDKLENKNSILDYYVMMWETIIHKYNEKKEYLILLEH